MAPIAPRHFFVVLIVGFFTMTPTLLEALRLTQSFDNMKCSYGERGSLTATCVNATPAYFKNTPYRFDHLDETLRCLNCSLETLESGSFDLSGNQIKNLDLSNSLIKTIRQRAFVGLIFLEKLILSNNNINSIYPGTFAGVKKITEVDLQNNMIHILSDEGFVELINLKTLNLKSNLIKTIAPNAFDGLASLLILDLSGNQIADIGDVFNNLTALEVLNLEHNIIMKLTGHDFYNFTSLHSINLAHNNIRSIPEFEFSDVKSLKELDLSYNFLDTIIPDSFDSLVYLERLDLSYNNLAEISQKTFQNLPSLRNLALSHNRLTIFQTGLYSGLPQLRLLDLSSNQIEDVEVTGVFSLQNLHSLDFSKNNITDIDYVGLLTRLPSLTYLNLQHNLLPCDLEKHMENYFSEDNFKFLIQGNEPGAVKCIDVPMKYRVPPKFQPDSLEGARKDDGSSSAATVWLFVIVAIILVMVCVLYYLQYRTFREMRMSSIHRSVSRVQLINSSDIEGRVQLKD